MLCVHRTKVGGWIVSGRGEAGIDGAAGWERTAGDYRCDSMGL